MSDPATAPVFNPFEEGYTEYPYRHYAVLREQDPVHQSPFGMVMCFAYDDIRQLLLEQRTTMSMGNLADGPAKAAMGASDKPESTALLGQDPPDHTRLRRLMSRAFTPRRIDGLSDAIRADVDRLLDDLEHRYRDGETSVDLIDGLAFPLPFSVISWMLGMPPGDEGQLRRWAHDVASAQDPLVTPEQSAAAAVALAAITEYVTEEVLPWKRRNLGEDLLTDLLRALDEGSLRSTAELLDQVTLLYMAGHETTVGLIGNGILNLLTHRDQLERMQADPSLIPGAVEELNRLDSPIQFAWRIAAADLEVRDRTIEAGQIAFLCVGSANHDPAHFGTDADDLDITRKDASEALSFGGGLHFCLGAALARREAALALGEVFRRFPGMELAGEPARYHRITFRSLEHLPVSLG